MKERFLVKNIKILWKTIRSKGKIILATLLNFTFTNGYLQSTC